jgi:hypothetical protein
VAFAKGGDSEEHLGGVFEPSPLSSYISGHSFGIIECHTMFVMIFTNKVHKRCRLSVQRANQLSFPMNSRTNSIAS